MIEYSQSENYFMVNFINCTKAYSRRYEGASSPWP